MPPCVGSRVSALLAALLLVAAALAGCSSPQEPTQPPVDTSPMPIADKVFGAREAAAAAIPYARAQFPDALLAALEATETNTTFPTVMAKLRQLGAPRDPDIGDGLTGGWGVRFATSKGPIRVAALANGSLRLEMALTLNPPGSTPGSPQPNLELWAVDSPQAARIAMADDDFRQQAERPGVVVEIALQSPDATYKNDPVKRVLAEDPFWTFLAIHPGEPGHPRVLVNGRTGERIYADPFGDILDQRYGHEHAAFAIFTNGQRVRFDDPAYDASQISGKVHMNVSEPDGGAIWHLEGQFLLAQPNLTLARILGQYGLHFEQGLLILDRHDGHNGATWPDEKPDAWHLFVSNRTSGVRNAFQEIVQNYTKYIPRDGDQVLLTYGSPTPVELAREEAVIPLPPATPRP